MQNTPKSGNPFFPAYQTALGWCDHVPAGVQDHDDCIVGSLGSISTQQQLAADRTDFLETALLLAILVTLALFVRRRLTRRRSLA
jgi:hypothetical protein